MDRVKMVVVAVALGTLVNSCLNPASGQWVSQQEQDNLTNLIPQGVPVPKGLKFYRPAEYNQGLTVTNEQDTITMRRFDEDAVYSNSSAVPNPNGKLVGDKCYLAPGGLCEIKGVGNSPAIYFPLGKKLKVYTEFVNVTKAPRLLPKISWYFPDGTIVIDLIYDASKVFEVRRAEVIDGKWQFTTPWISSDTPRGYIRPAKNSCTTCHADAGSQETYGMGVRGSNGNFSFSPLYKNTQSILNELKLIVEDLR